MEWYAWLVIGLVGSVFLIGFMIFVFSFYKKVEQGKALVVSRTNRVEVTFTGSVVIPIIHKAEIMDISVKTIEVDRRGKNGLICRDNIRADIKVTFYVRVNKAEDDVLRVAQAVGCERASQQQTLEELFGAKFSEALKTVGKQMEFEQLFLERERFKERIIAVIGEDLNGYKLDDAAIDYLEQTPLESLEEDNVLDSEGIRKIVEITNSKRMSTNENRRNAERVIKQQDVETREKILELERQQADAEARQAREIAAVRAREQAEADKVQSEEHLKAERARITTEEQVAIAEENRKRQVEIAAKSKERTIAVETERVVRDRDLEMTERERLVALKRIEKDKNIEEEKKIIAEVIRQRVMVERTVAEEEQKIKDTVELATADRDRKVQVIVAERDAEEKKVAVTTDAQAKEEAAKRLFQEMVTMAEGERVRAEKRAEGDKLLAEALVATEAASGMAKVKVREAEARAIELQGKAEAVASTEKYKAEAYGTEARGGAEASAKKALLLATADGTEKQGLAEARAWEAKLKAEADGITQKADAMKKFNEAGKEHEELKLHLAKDERIELAAIDARVKVAAEQAMVLGEAVKSAKIDIVGGGDAFLQSFFKSITVARSIDGFMEHSQTAKNLVGENGELLNRVKDLLGKGGLQSEDIKNLAISALVGRVASRGLLTDAGIPAAAGDEAATRQRLQGLSVEELLALLLVK